MDDADRLREAGLYDPEAPDAAERLELLRFNLAQGLTVDELVEAERLGRQEYVGGDPHIRPSGERFTLAELSETSCVPLEKIRRYWRAVGLAEPASDERLAYEADIEIYPLIQQIEAMFGEQVTLQLLRTFGAGISRIAEAEVTAFTTIVGADLVESGRSVELAQTNAGIGRLIPQIARFIDVLHRHHLQAAIVTLFSDPSTRESQAKHLAVGFADLVGYTAFTARSDPQSVSSLVERFEALARDTVTEQGGRVVKMIGDEVMFVAGDATTACEIARELESEAGQLSALSGIRVGVACGAVLTGYGDYYGPVVNLASRLVSAADPGTVLVDDEVRRHLLDAGSTMRLRPAGSRLLKGMPEPVEVHTLLPPG